MRTALLFLLLASCGEEQDSPEVPRCAQPTPSSLSLSEFQYFEYALAWEPAEPIVAADGGTVTLNHTASGIGNLDVQLVPCPTSSRDHDPNDDVSWIDLSFFESLGDEVGTVGQGRSGPDAYCSALYVVSSLDADHATIDFRGTYVDALGTEHELVLTGTLPAGSERPLEFGGFVDGPARVTLIRSTAKTFANLDVGGLEAADLAYDAARALVASTRAVFTVPCP